MATIPAPRVMAQTEQEPSTRRLKGLSGLFEGIRSFRERKRVEKGVLGAIRAGDADSAVSLSASLPSLAPKHREKILFRAQKILGNYSDFPYESDQKVSSLTAAAEFFSVAAKTLPSDGDSRKITDHYSKAISLFKNTAADTNLYRQSDAAHLRLRLSCLRALWELEYGNFDFWEGQLLDSATRPFTITRLLEMPVQDDFGEHGWFLLRKHLPRLSYDIAQSASPSKKGFFISMLLDDDRVVLKAALEGAVYLEPVPEEILDIVSGVSKMEGMASHAALFELVVQEKKMLDEAGDVQFRAAHRLITAYRGGAMHLKRLLDQTGLEMLSVVAEPGGSTEEEKAAQQQGALEAIAELSMSGISLPGVRLRNTGPGQLSLDITFKGEDGYGR